MTPVVQQAGEPTALSCPFCGSNDISDGEILGGALDETETDYTQSECRACGAVGPRGHLNPGEIDYGSVKAIAAWNRRASRPQQPQAETPLTAGHAKKLLDALDTLMDFRPSDAGPMPGMMRGGKYVVLADAKVAILRALDTGAHPPEVVPEQSSGHARGLLRGMRPPEAEPVAETWLMTHESALAPRVMVRLLADVPAGTKLYASPPEAQGDTSNQAFLQEFARDAQVADREMKSWSAQLRADIAKTGVLAFPRKTTASPHPPEAEPVVKQSRFTVCTFGPDDVEHFDDELTALRHANSINRTYIADRLKHPDDEVLCVATVDNGHAPEARSDAGWISVEQKPIPTDCLVDIYVPGIERRAGCYYDRICDEWRQIERGILARFKRDRISHWMPVPLPPEAQEPKT